MRRFHAAFGAALIAGAVLPAAARAAPAEAAPAPVIEPWVGDRAEADAYTRYELLDPASHKFHILYEITATTPGAKLYFNPIRPGSVASDEHVYDRATGKELKFSVVHADQARAEGLSDADPHADYIRVELARPVPADGGQGRILIEKTYEDAKSYHMDGGDIVFDRPLGIKRSAVVLPRGWELADANYPSQVIEQADGRIGIAFWNGTPAEAPLKLRARKIMSGAPASSSVDARALDERAHQNRDIVYFLNRPETNSFFLYHDYTESRPGVGVYVNVVRTGSHANGPAGKNLDTGAPLAVKILKGDEITAAHLPADEAPDKVTPDTEVVVFSFPPVMQGGSARLRMFETYTDPPSYHVDDKGELIFHRSFGRAADAVVLPDGWMLTNSSIPATVTTLGDGRVRLDFVNPRNDEIDVIITARKR
ncbi:MAG TPA: hypothetical protein VGL66_00235 [Caulobacteraceae bacterium]